MMIDEIKAVFMEECIKWLTKESTEPVDEESLIVNFVKQCTKLFGHREKNWADYIRRLIAAR